MAAKMNWRSWLFLMLLALLVVGCAAGPNTVAGGDGAAGFWLGLWHGIISPIAWLVSA